MRNLKHLMLPVFGTVALIGCQQVLTTPSGSTTVESTSTLAFKPLVIPPPIPQKIQPVPAAVSTGSFEEPFVKPTPALTRAPNAEPLTPPAIYELAEQRAASIARARGTLFESGIASTYGEGDGFQDNLTACGQVFDTHITQVAHKTLPCGTLLRIEDTDTGRSVVAEVTDRGPYIYGRVVDLSWGAFSQLDPTSPGLLNVDVYVLGGD